MDVVDESLVFDLDTAVYAAGRIACLDFAAEASAFEAAAAVTLARVIVVVYVCLLLVSLRLTLIFRILSSLVSRVSA